MKHRYRGGFTLVELLVVVAILGLLMALLLPAVQIARESARRAHCASNVRQVGLAITQYCDTHGGRWPETTHTSQPDPTTGKYERAWIYTVAPFMESVDSIRICASDLAGPLRFAGRGTSYTLNGYLSSEARPAFPNRKQLSATSKTIIAFELSEKKDARAMLTGIPNDVDVFNDHVHSFNWFSTTNVNRNLVFTAIGNEVAIDRHGDAAHYLYADGHVDLIVSEQVANWSSRPFNFALPPTK